MFAEKSGGSKQCIQLIIVEMMDLKRKLSTIIKKLNKTL